jgi:ribosomal protein L16 Arg81 hydroxylase
MLDFLHSVPQPLVRPMISNLQELIAPFTGAEFFAMLRTRSLVFRRGSDEKRFESLLDWDTFRSVIESDFPPDKLRVTRGGTPVLPHIYLERGRVNAKNLAKLLDHGASLVAVPFEPYVPQLESLCANVKEHVGEKTSAGAIATTGRGGAFTLHYDAQDIIVLQIAGIKRWKIYDCPLAWPVTGMPVQAPPQTEPVLDDILRPGDFLFVPAGHWHHCENGGDLSLHVGIMIEPPTGWHAFKAMLPQILADEMFRIPLTRFGSPAEKAAHEAALKQRLIERVEQISFSQFFTQGEEAQPSNEDEANPE